MLNFAVSSKFRGRKREETKTLPWTECLAASQSSRPFSSHLNSCTRYVCASTLLYVYFRPLESQDGGGLVVEQATMRQAHRT